MERNPGNEEDSELTAEDAEFAEVNLLGALGVLGG
jgi:hypothetical protein